jgi:hypothetical protein
MRNLCRKARYVWRTPRLRRRMAALVVRWMASVMLRELAGLLWRWWTSP